ncbi:MAG: UDP-4-amino-4,6-dideoxy-N-acetyl-beta-L-altrosamine transaminase [Sulfurospirillum sp.]|nr:MAG: UDP-4-amino-4,6-dideoxy-N-acetyl-beta-L-altrosamine transaminase [Sulfurospirillum sp.]
MKPIPYGRQTINEADIDAVGAVLGSDLITTGPITAEFEQALCTYTGAKYAVAVANGTAALHLASLAILKPGDQVLTTPNSFLATSNAILYAGAKPIFVDICEDGNIDLDLCKEAIEKNPRIKALYGVAFSGNMLDQQRLKALKEKFGITILEDNAHAIGATQNGIKAGSCKYSDCSIFSFHPVKNMTTGEGGAITTNVKEIYEKLLLLRNHGMQRRSDIAPWYYEMRDLGFNYRITDFQCALGLSQLSKLDRFLAKRRAIAKRYHERFEGTVIKLLYPWNEGSAYHLFVVRIDFMKTAISKKELFLKLLAKGVGVQLHYIPINRQPYYQDLGYGDEKTPVMDRYYEEALSLPIYPLLSEEEQAYVIETLFEALAHA